MSANDPASNRLAPGTRLGRYVITRLIGGGAMGQVYEARHAELDKRVAIKVMDAAMGASPELRARFLREGQAAARVRHPHAVDISDVGAEGTLLYLVMEYLDGEDLAALIAREAPLAPERIADIMLPVMAALADVHVEGIVHRDLKPANIFLARNRQGSLRPKVLDFGVSKVAGAMGGQALTAVAAVLGTPVYMSPEQTRASSEVDLRSDIYSLGTILYECATGKRSITSDNLMVIFQRIAEGEFTPPRKLIPTIPVGFEAVILRAMALRPEDRFESMNDFGRALVPFASPAAQVTWGPTFAYDPERASVEAALRASVIPLARPLVPPSSQTRPTEDTLPPPFSTAQSKAPFIVIGVLATLVGALGLIATLQYLDARDVARGTMHTPRNAPPTLVDAGVPSRDAAITPPDASTPTDVPAAPLDAATIDAQPVSEEAPDTGHHHRHHGASGSHHHHAR